MIRRTLVRSLVVGAAVAWSPTAIAGNCDSKPLTRTETVTKVSSSFCDATCGPLQNAGMHGPTASGSPAANGRLEYTDRYHGACRVNGGILNGQCTAPVICPPGQAKFSDGDVWRIQKFIAIIRSMNPII